MWARTVEVMLGCWLLVSPFVFEHEPSDTYFWAADLGGGALIALFSLFSFWEPTKRAHALTFVTGASLALIAYFGTPPLPPALQNHILVGVLLMMMAIIPTEATLPPDAWQRHEEERTGPSTTKGDAS